VRYPMNISLRSAAADAWQGRQTAGAGSTVSALLLLRKQRVASLQAMRPSEQLTFKKQCTGA
jgi:hypothetical protein